MKTSKRILSLLLVVVMLFTILPVPALATGSKPQTSVDTGDVTIEGTNGFGNLLSQEIQESQEESATAEEGYEAGYSVIDLTFEGATATVEYSSLEEARLVVAVYSEDGLQMLASGETTVSPDADMATVTIEGDMPEYFLASAYLMDTYDLSPLCAAYDTPMYTREMQELLESTVDDYAPDRVLNLDEDETTNFAVYADDTIVIEGGTDVNTVVSTDEENNTYVIANADQNITALVKGDVFVYPYGEGEMLIVKVADIKVNGTNVTITGSEDLTMEDVFSHVKIESTGIDSNVTIDGSTATEGIEYFDPDGITPYGAVPRKSTSGENSHSIGLSFDAIKLGGDYANVKLTGKVTLSVTFSVDYYVSMSYQRTDISGEVSLKGSVGVSGELKFPIKLGKIKFEIIPGVLQLAMSTDFVIKTEGKIEASLTLSLKTGLVIERGGKQGNTNDGYCDPDIKLETKFEGSLFFGLETEIGLEIAHGLLADIKITAEAGEEYALETDIPPIESKNSEDEQHLCDVCYSGEATRKFSLEFSAKFLQMKRLSIKAKLLEHTKKLYDIYYTPGKMPCFQRGHCPNLAYKLTVNVVDTSKQPVKDAAVSVGEFNGTTDKNGIVTVFLPVAEYEISVQQGNITRQHTLYLDSAQKVKISLAQDGESKHLFDYIIPDDYIDETKYIASGKCGDKVHWTLSDDGILNIAGKGAMNYTCPWYVYRYNISSVIIGNGVTTIMSSAFSGCTSLTSVKIPDSVTTIGAYAFEGCTSLTSVKIPDSVTTIGAYAFEGCTSLTGVEIPDAVTTLKAHTFDNCTSLTTIEIPDSVSVIDEYAFYNCTGLTSVEVPDGITAIGRGAFENCTKLTTVNIPDSVTTIAQDTFNGCAKLTSVEIPHGVTTIGASAFACCDSLTTVKIPDSLTTIGISAFEDCTSLKSAKFPNSVTTIGDHAFSGCTGLTTVEIPSSVTTIAAWTFSGCDSLTIVDIPDSVITIGERAFIDCDSLSRVDIPDSVITIGEWAFAHCDSLTTVEIPSSVSIIAAWTFADCDSLTSVNIPDSVTIIAGYAFHSCDSLTSVNIPNSVTIIDDEAFWSCVSLTNVKIPDGVATIGDSAFAGCDSLTTVEIPSSVTTIEGYAFYADISLKRIVFYGDAPSIGEEVFAHVPATAYYPAGNSTWTPDVMEAFCGYITWVPYTLDENGNMITNAAGAVTMAAEIVDIDVTDTPDEEPVMQNGQVVSTIDFGDQDEPLNPNAVYDGEYSTVVTDAYTLKTASFSGLVPGEQYVLLAMVSIDVEDPLAADNLLYIDQATALEDGTLVFQYVQRTPTDISYVVACGASNKDLNDAEITFPEMVVDGETLVVNPTVVYDGKTLVEGQDYFIQGTVSVTEPGTYSCTIKGVRNYSGLVECAYTVIGPYYEVGYGFCGDNMVWTLYDNGRMIISGMGEMAEFDSYSSVPWNDSRSSITTVIIEEGVTTIGNFAFAECANLTSVKFSESVTEIGNGAFCECTSLISVEIPDSVTAIGINVFQDCTSLTRVAIGDSLTEISTGAFGYCSGLSQVTMGDSVDTIQYGAFQSCTSLKNAILPNSVIKIDNAAFRFCKSLESVQIGEAVETIGSSAFSGCTSLANVEIPESVTTIGDYAFGSCTSLTGIYVDEHNPNYSCDDRGVLFDREKVELIQAPGAISGSYEIPDSVSAICPHAFYSCAGLTGVVIPDSVTSIGDYAFSYCKKLGSVSINGKVTAIGEHAFSWCEDLRSVTLPDGVTTIGEHAFSGCASLTSVRIPDSVTAIGSYAFNYCTSLTNVDIPESVTTIGSKAFRSCIKLSQVTFMGDAPAIGEEAFFEVTAMAHYPAGNVTWTEEVRQNYGGAITWTHYCIEHSYKAVVTEPTCTEQGYTTHTCSKCGDSYVTDETEVIDHIYESVATEDGKLIHTCITCGDSYTETDPAVFQYVVYEDYVEITGYTANSSELDIPAEIEGLPVTHIGPYAFSNCTGLVGVTIPNTVTSIGERAFQYCEGLISITIPDGINVIGNFAFVGCFSLESIRFAGDAPEFGNDVFSGVEGSVYYSGDNRTWTSEVMQRCNDYSIDWVAEGEVFGIEIVSTPECGFVDWEPNLSELCVELIYGNDVHRPTDISKLIIGEIDVTTAGKKNVTVRYDAFSAEFTYGVHDREPGVVLDPSLYPESEHKYKSNLDETQTIFWPGATSIVLAFSTETCVENNRDWLFVYDGKGNRIAYYTGNQASGVTLEVPGDTVNINLFTDYAGGYYGYSFDSITAMGAVIHTGTENILTIEPTCTDPGRSYFICEICDEEQYTIIPELGHNNVNGVCTRCGEVEPTEPDETAITITSQPVDYVGLVGDTATFTVEAEGEGLKYQWYCSTDGGANWGTTGVTENTQSVVFLAYRNHQLYRCVITDAEGNTVASEAAELKAQEIALEITGQPENYIGAVGDEAVFVVEANGNGLTYEWFVSSDGGTTWAKSYMTGYMSDTQTAVLRPYRDGYQLYCKVSDIFGNTVNSDIVSMTVKSGAVTINSQPQSIDNAAILQMYTFTVEAEGDNLTYLWEVSTDGGATWEQSWSDGYNTDTLNIRMYQYRDGYQYRCVVTSGLKTVVTTEAATLNLQASSVAIESSPMSVYALLYEEVTMHVEATGTDLTYQWYYSTDDGATWVENWMTGYNTDTLSIVAIPAREALYMCKVTDGSGTSVWSEPAQMKILSTELKITSQPENFAGTVGDTASFTVSAEGDGVRYRWYLSSDGGTTWSECWFDGYNTNTLTFYINASRAANQYRCVLTDIAGNEITSNAVSVVTE